MAIKFEDTPGPKGKTPEKPAAAARPRAEAEVERTEAPKEAAQAKRTTKVRKKS